MEKLVPARLAILGHPQRLALFRLLMRRYPDAVPAGELGAAMGLKPSTLSAYLSALMQAGLVTRQRAGTSLQYAIDVDAVRATFDYLLLDCCRGRPEVCSPAALPDKTGAAAPQGRKAQVLFICTGNSARSIMAEAILRDLAGDRFDAWSAGTLPGAGPNPVALEVLRRNGHDTAGLASKSLDAVRGPGAPTFDFVITVCDQAANEECPAWPGPPLGAHWGMPDPGAFADGDAWKRRAFQRTYDLLQERIQALCTLPVGEMDRISLQQAIDRIGRITSEVSA